MKTLEELIRTTGIAKEEFTVDWDKKFKKYQLIEDYLDTLDYLPISRVAKRAIVHAYLIGVVCNNQYHIYTNKNGFLNPGIITCVFAPTSCGKGATQSDIEQRVLRGFYKKYNNIVVSRKLEAAQRIIDDMGIDVIEEGEERLAKLGPPLMWVGFITEATFDQLKTLFGVLQFGNLFYIVDEILSRVEVLQSPAIQNFIESYESGKSKPRGIKNTAENARITYNGHINSNVLAFGTGTKIKTSPEVKKLIDVMGEEGFARRSFMVYQDRLDKKDIKTPKERKEVENENKYHKAANELNMKVLAALDKRGVVIEPDLDCYKLLREYETLRDFRQQEEPIQNRANAYNGLVSKALKISGFYAMLEGEGFITKERFLEAVAYVESTTGSIKTMYPPQDIHLQLLAFLKDNTETMYPTTTLRNGVLKGIGAKGQDDAILMAESAARTEGTVITTQTINGVEMHQAIIMTKAEQCKFAATKEGYTRNMKCQFVDLMESVKEGSTITNHQVVNGAIAADNIIEGFTMLNLVLGDSAMDWTLESVRNILKDYMSITYETEVVPVDDNGEPYDMYKEIVIMLPISHTIKLDAYQYYDYFNNLKQVLPFGDGLELQTRDFECPLNSIETGVLNQGKIMDGLQFLHSTEEVVRGVNIEVFNQIEHWFFAQLDRIGSKAVVEKYYEALSNMMEKEDILDYLIDFNKKLGTYATNWKVIDDLMK